MDDCRLVSHQDPIELLLQGLPLPVLPLSVLFWLFLFGYLWCSDQLDPAALQKNIFPSSNVSVHKLYDGAIIYGICIIILGGMNLFAYILFICWYFNSEIHESSVYHPGFDTVLITEESKRYLQRMLLIKL